MNASAGKLFYTAAVATALLSFPAVSHAAAPPSNAVCESRSNGSAAKLVECIQKAALWAHLVDFQRIANANPGADGHASRDTGGTGYAASIDYVAELMTKAGYRVTIQPYNYADFSLAVLPTFSIVGQTNPPSTDWYVARLSGQGVVTAPVEPAGSGCAPGDYAQFSAGRIALVQRGACDFDTQVANAQGAGAAGVVIFNTGGPAHPNRKGRGAQGEAFQAYLGKQAAIPVVGVASHALGQSLIKQYLTGGAPVVRLDVQTRKFPNRVDYNLIADSRFGDPNHVVVVEAHLDSIYGAGMLDNASGSATILEVALKMAKTHTRNQLRFIWFGGEEINLLGSAYYTKSLSPSELGKIVFDIDSDVTASPNYDISIADPQFASSVKHFPPNVVPASMLGGKYFSNYFSSVGLASRPASFGNDGTDSNSFSLVGVPNTGILTQQDCCKTRAEVKIWGGSPGNYEGDIPSFDGGCVDNPHLWCDNLSNNDPDVLEFISKGLAYVVFELANDVSLNPSGK
jgi:hypothetical protein